MKNLKEKIFILSFILFLVLVPLLSFVVPEKEFSLFEFRFLSAIPEYKNEKIIDTEYYAEWEEYFSDRIFMRTKLLSFYTKINLYLLNKPVVNDVVISSDNTLLSFDGFYSINQSEVQQKLSVIEKNLVRLQGLANGVDAKLYVVTIPEQASMLHNSYPYYLNNYENKKYIRDLFFNVLKKNNIEHIDMQKVFEAKNYKKLYAKTDHHYNYFGAIETYHEIVKKISQTSDFDISPLKYSDIDFKKIDLPFYGSRSRKLFGEYSKTECIYVGYPKEKVDYTRIDEGVLKKSELFDLPKETYSTYNIYMGGDKAETVITTNREQLPNILLIGDSFTNPIETLLYYNANEFRSLDFRYYLDASLTEYLENFKPDIIVFLRDDGNFLNIEGNGNMNFYMDN